MTINTIGEKKQIEIPNIAETEAIASPDFEKSNYKVKN